MTSLVSLSHLASVASGFCPSECCGPGVPLVCPFSALWFGPGGWLMFLLRQSLFLEEEGEWDRDPKELKFRDVIASDFVHVTTGMSGTLLNIASMRGCVLCVTPFRGKGPRILMDT